MIGQDIEKDIAHAKAAEDKSQAEFEAFETKSKEQIADLKSDISELEGSKSDKESSATEYGGANHRERRVECGDEDYLRREARMRLLRGQLPESSQKQADRDRWPHQGEGHLAGCRVQCRPRPQP